MLGTVLAQGQSINLRPGAGLAANLQDISFGGIVGALIILLIIIAAVVFFFMLLIGGIRWITSGGDKTQTEAARSQVTAALVGLVIVFAAWAILQLIEAFFGISLGDLQIINVQQLSP